MIILDKNDFIYTQKSSEQIVIEIIFESEYYIRTTVEISKYKRAMPPIITKRFILNNKLYSAHLNLK